MNTTNLLGPKPCDTIPGLDEDQLTIERVIPKNEDTLTTITNLARKLIQLQDRQAEEAKVLEATTNEIKDIAEKRLPDLLESVGLTEMTVGGRKLAIKTDYFGKPGSGAFEWLRERNMGSVIKEKVMVGVDDKKRLDELGISYTSEESIHPSTLKALIKEQIEANNEFPRDLFGVYVADKVVVK